MKEWKGTGSNSINIQSEINTTKKKNKVIIIFYIKVLVNIDMKNARKGKR